MSASKSEKENSDAGDEAVNAKCRSWTEVRLTSWAEVFLFKRLSSGCQVDKRKPAKLAAFLSYLAVKSRVKFMVQHEPFWRLTRSLRGALLSYVMKGVHAGPCI